MISLFINDITNLIPIKVINIIAMIIHEVCEAKLIRILIYKIVAFIGSKSTIVKAQKFIKLCFGTSLLCGSINP